MCSFHAWWTPVSYTHLDVYKRQTYYCFTNECLRDYILRYFGEYGSNYCGNCSNCLSQFETVDVTDIARSLIGCVESSHQRYGTTVTVSYTHLSAWDRTAAVMGDGGN